MKKEVIILFASVLLMLLSSCSKVAEQTLPKSLEELSDEEINSICQQEKWPSDCNMIPLLQGRIMCERCRAAGINQEKEIKGEIDKFITANPLDLSQIARISKFRSCYGHDYSGLNIAGEMEALRSMKHYIEFSRQYLGSENTVKVFAPFDGKITEIMEAGGKQVFISADAASTWHFIFFHISTVQGLEEGTPVKAGQLVGYAYVSEWPTFDIAFKEFTREGQIFESPFPHMQDSILEEFASYGITPENIIFSKQYRDMHPCPIKGIRDGEEAFTGQTEKEDFVFLK